MSNFNLVILVAIFLGCALAKVQPSSATVQLSVFGSSSIWWMAVAPQNDGSLTTKVEIKDASTSYVAMEFTAGWGYYTYTAKSSSGFKAPLTFRLTSSTGSVITVAVASIVPGAVVDTGAQFGKSSVSSGAATDAPTLAPTSAPTKGATSAPTKAPTAAPTKGATSAPTKAPTTAPTKAPTTSPTKAPTTAPTKAPTKAPTGGSTAGLCDIVPTSSEPMKLLVPLYVYPGAAWDALIAASSSVDIIAIINPNSGPESAPDSSYTSYMTKFKNAGIVMIGYVHTSYGARAIADVQADINTYATKYPGLAGIFFDEASSAAADIAYYTTAYKYVMSKAGYVHSILNPGTQPDAGYFPISSSIVVFEDAAANFAKASLQSWVTCAPNAAAKTDYKYRFAAIAYASSQTTASSLIASFQNRGIGLVYVTDGAGGCCTYNDLVSYFAAEANIVKAAN